MAILQDNWHRISKLLRTCAACGSFGNSNDIICEYCLNKLANENQSIDSMVEINSIFVHYLYTWTRDQNRCLSLVLAVLKNNEFAYDWFPFAERLFHRNRFQENDHCPSIYIPAPTSKPMIGNHSMGLARALLGLDPGNSQLIDCLRVLSNNPQKSLKRSGRAKRRILNNEKFTKTQIENQRFIFVDDIVTTGATAFAAWEALGRPKRFEVWCVALRRLATD